jgi:hypothetical protein
MPLVRNPGYLPDDCVEFDAQRQDTGKVFRVRVVTFGGYDTAGREPKGWPASGRGACKWRIDRPPHPFDIEFYERLS